MFLDSLLFSANVTLPTILMLLLGIYLRRKKMLDDSFCETGSKLVFNIALPAYLFLSIVNNPADYGSQIPLVLAGILGSILVFVISEWLAARYIEQRAYRGIFVQGVFRGNTGILGLALCINAYGTAATAPASVYTACITLFFNVLGVLTLSRSLSDKKMSWANVLKSLAKNPLIISISLGILVSKLGLELPTPLLKTGDYLGKVALPLALICTGASLNFKMLKKLDKDNASSSVVIWASLGRLLIVPLLMVILGKFVFDLNTIALGILFLMASTPVAAVSYPMVRSFGGDATAAANLIGVTTLGAMFTSSLGIVILRSMGWM
ncbi:malonate transporter [Pasteurellaceae bacterium RH1A]|nr:malonate transporter [Pasteurellaceae bacterium RH1A]